MGLVIDAGSRGGIHPMFQEVAPILELVGFEPDEEECRRLNAQARKAYAFRSATHVPYGLSSADGFRRLYRCRSAGLSSFYMPNRMLLQRFPDVTRFDMIRTSEIPVRALDHLYHESCAALPRFVGFIKLDTQGSELDILTGASTLLTEQVVGVQVEVAFVGAYEGQPLFRDIDLFLAGMGFTLFKLRRAHWVRRHAIAGHPSNSGQAMFADALYLKDPLLHDASHLAIKTPHHAEALILIAALFDLHDFALELLADARLSAMVDAERARQYVVRRSQRFNRHVAGTVAMALLRGLKAYATHGGDLKYLFPLLRQHHPSWARGDNDFYTQL